MKSQTKPNKNNDKMPSFVAFWKYPGETLAVMLRRFREEQGYDEAEKITYAGRLDPMAEGIVPLLVGEARFQKDRLLKAKKTYEVQVLLGASTDTGDMLGVVTKFSQQSYSSQQLQQAVESLTAVTELEYPLYSSRPVEGVPLFMHARKGNTVTLPVKAVTIYSAIYTGSTVRTLEECITESVPLIQTVQGDFRQEECSTSWSSLLQTEPSATVTIVSMTITSSSGAYMRVLAEMVGKTLGAPALAYTIKRTKIGE